ncbi:MAG: metalloregulator ArsR/SmtB family transcription factor [Firmicutes bacterium]|nr:metalloregulator ArsR/SmtB family transcription factor [Bacillota bacterium]
MTDEAERKLVAFVKVLADPSRLRIMGLLATREVSVEELAACLSLRTPTVSHHLGRLRQAGLVSMRADGNTHLYRLESAALDKAKRELLTTETLAAMVQVDGDAWERKVLRDFLNGEQLKEIPASRKKRLVILAWLASQFAPGVHYPEAVVNELLRRHHEDCATLRRELVGNGFMARANSIYWRVSPRADHAGDAPEGRVAE